MTFTIHVKICHFATIKSSPPPQSIPLYPTLLHPTPHRQTQRSVYDGVLEAHVRQKRAAIERALAMENSFAGGMGNAADSAATNVTRSSMTSNGGGSSATDDGEGGGGGSLEAAGVSAKEIKNIFTELRKGANHPLMLLNYFKGGGKVEEVVDVLHRTGYFGAQATKEMVRRELVCVCVCGVCVCVLWAKGCE